MNQAINVNGKLYNSWDEWTEEEKKNPNSKTLIWENQQMVNCTFINGRMIYPDGSYGNGKCWWKGKCYEGKIEYRGNDLYVGGEFVKAM